MHLQADSGPRRVELQEAVTKASLVNTRDRAVNRRNIDAIVVMLTNCQQSEMVGICRHALSYNVFNSPSNAPHALEVLVGVP